MPPQVLNYDSGHNDVTKGTAMSRLRHQHFGLHRIVFGNCTGIPVPYITSVIVCGVISGSNVTVGYGSNGQWPHYTCLGRSFRACVVQHTAFKCFLTSTWLNKVYNGIFCFL